MKNAIPIKKMKKILIIMALSTLLALQAVAHSALDRIVVISDPHLLSPQLVTPGSAIDKADAGETKMMAMSDDIMTAIIDSVIGINPRVVLIAGDLTHNGERLSHERMAWHLQRLTDHGILALVIPGNHDCNNPYAVSYDGDKTSPAPTVTREEFAHIYRDYGYGASSRRDTASLSYSCEPLNGVVLIGIDSNMDDLNTLKARGDSANTYHNAGRVKPETLQWVVEQAQQARSQGKMVMAMMHHHLVQHFDQQDRFLSNYIVRRHDAVARQLMQAGVHTIFTGHLHVTDAATAFNDDRTDSIVEVATGSAICYPFAMRVATLDAKHTAMTIDTRWLDATASCPDLRELGRQRIVKATPGMADMISGKAWNRFGSRMGQIQAMLESDGNKTNLPQSQQQATQLALRHLSEVMSRTLLAIVEGNENDKDYESIIEQGKQGLRAMIDEVAPSQADNLWEFFMAEVYPKLEPMVRSVLEDRNAVGTPNESRTDDLSLSVKL